MATYNVKMSVVELLEADSEADAIRLLWNRVQQAGLSPFDDGEAFLSECDTEGNPTR